MLARNLKPAAELGLSDTEHSALVAVLGFLEREEAKHRIDPYKKLPGNGFNMDAVGSKSDCGTCACIMGWARIMTGDEDLFYRCNLHEQSPGVDGLRDLFLFKCTPVFDGIFKKDASNVRNVTLEQGAAALRNYLTLGEPRWAEVLT